MDGELQWLYHMATAMDSIVEIGSWKGRSTHALLTGCKGLVYAVDHFHGTKAEGEAGAIWTEGDEVYNQFMANVGHCPNLRVLRGSSQEMVECVPVVDMVFIDGDHTYENVKLDVTTWLRKARKVICGHDFGHEDVQRAVHEVIGKVDRFGPIWSYLI